jgi:hypothetical protein
MANGSLLHLQQQSLAAAWSAMLCVYQIAFHLVLQQSKLPCESS